MKSTLKIALASGILSSLFSGIAGAATNIDTKQFQPGRALEILRGPLPPLFFAPVKDAVCPNGADETFRNDVLHCTVDVAQFANVVCPNPSFPRYVALATGANPSERDICAASTADGQAITSTTNLSEQTQRRTCDATDTLLRHNTAGFICMNTGKGILFGASEPLTGAGVRFFKSPANNHNERDYYDAATTNETRFNVNVDFERLPSDGSKSSRSYVAGVPIADVDGQNWRLDTTVQGATDRYKRIVKRQVSAILVDHR